MRIKTKIKITFRFKCDFLAMGIDNKFTLSVSEVVYTEERSDEVERDTRIELAFHPWEGRVMPLYESRI